MVINGKERGFRYTVRANIKLAKHYPGGNSQRFPELLDNEEKFTNFIVDAAVVMNASYENKKKIEDEDYTPCYLTKEEIDDMEMKDFRELTREILGVLTEDAKPTIETKEPKGKKKQSKVQ